MSLWRHHRRRTAGALVATVLFAGLVPASVARADSVSDAQARMDAALDKIDQFNEYAAILAADLEDAQAALVDAQAAVEDSKSKIAVLEGQLTTLQGELGDLALSTFMNGDEASGTGSLLTGAGTVTEVVEREEYARLAMSEGQNSTDQMDAVLSDLDAERQRLETAEQQSEDLIDSVSQNKKAAEDAANKAEDAYAKAKQDYGEALVARQLARQKKLLADAAAAQAAAAARLAAGNGGGGGGGGASTGGNSGTSGGSGSSGSGSSGAGRNVPPPSPGASGAVSAAQSQIGVAYRYATSSPGESFDCSGLTAWAWSQAGVSLPHQSRAQYASTTHVSPSEAQPGDLIFFYSPISHVGIYIGGGMMVDAANKATGVRQTAVNWGKVVGVGRP